MKARAWTASRGRTQLRYSLGSCDDPKSIDSSAISCEGIARRIKILLGHHTKQSHQTNELDSVGIQLISNRFAKAPGFLICHGSSVPRCSTAARVARGDEAGCWKRGEWPKEEKMVPLSVHSSLSWAQELLFGSSSSSASLTNPEASFCAPPTLVWPFFWGTGSNFLADGFVG